MSKAVPGRLAAAEILFSCLLACLTANAQTSSANASRALDHGQVGIRLARVPDDASAGRLGGFLITYVWRRSPAAVAGLKPGDIIVAVNHASVFGKPTDQITGLTGAAGETVSFTICRGCEGRTDKLLTFEGLKRVTTLPQPDRAKGSANEWLAIMTENIYRNAADAAWNPPSAEPAQPMTTLSDNPITTQPPPVEVPVPVPNPDKHSKLWKVLTTLGTITGATNDASSEVGEWKQENHDRYNPKEIWLTLYASGDYKKVTNVGMFSSGRMATSESGTWTSAGTVVQLSGDKDYPPSTIDLRSFVRGR